MAGVDAKTDIPKHRKSRCTGFLLGDYRTKTCLSPDFCELLSCSNSGHSQSCNCTPSVRLASAIREPYNKSKRNPYFFFPGTSGRPCNPALTVAFPDSGYQFPEHYFICSQLAVARLRTRHIDASSSPCYPGLLLARSGAFSAMLPIR
jgi:hypothetical protein